MAKEAKLLGHWLLFRNERGSVAEVVLQALHHSAPWGLKASDANIASHGLDRKFQRIGCFPQTPHLVAMFTTREDHWGLIQGPAKEVSSCLCGKQYNH